MISIDNSCAFQPFKDELLCLFKYGRIQANMFYFLILHVGQ